MHQAKLRIDLVVVQNPLRTAAEDQPGPFVRIGQFDRAAGLLHAQYRDQPLLHPITPDEVLDVQLLADSAGHIFVGTPRGLSECLGVGDEFLGFPLQVFQKVGPPDPEGVVHPGIQSVLTVERQIALENHPVETRQYTDNQVTKLGDESFGELHGVLLRMVV